MAENRSGLTPEEHDAITQMVKSPGWRVLMEHLVLPELSAVTKHVDSMAHDDRTTQFYRGAKHILLRFMQTVYTWARLRNPLEEHYTGLLAAIRMYTEDLDMSPHALQTTETPEPPRRQSKPLL